jgi:ABC-type nitrate/sulfonate/bicarbonate transport system substrate-binding protein
MPSHPGTRSIDVEVQVFRLRTTAIGALVLALAACASVSSATPSAASLVPSPSIGAPSASASPSEAPPSAAPSVDLAHPDVVRFALDWTPNTDHTGLFVAQAKGWYDAAAIDLQILPYSSILPETLMATGQADCGISFQDSLTFAVASGARIRSVMAVLQHAASAIAVLADSSIARPRDLDGKTYAGFGYANEVPTLKAVIKADGGRGDFKVVVADSTAYEALYSHKADFTIPFLAWEGVEATERGIALRTFAFTDYGFPDFYQVVIACSNAWLAGHPDAARRFLAATQRGYALAASDPDAAAALLIGQNPGVFSANLKLPLDSARFLASGGYLVDASGTIGTQTLAQWTAYSKFLYDQGLLAGPDGKPLAAPPDYAALFTNEFLP